MLKDKRKFERFDLPLIVKFKPTHGSARYSIGLTKNFSYDGLCLEAREFNFIPNENLELELKLPQSNSSVSLFGDVIWKRQDGNTNLAGIRLRMEDKKMLNKLVEKISSYANISPDNIIPGKKKSHKKEDKTTAYRAPEREIESSEKHQRSGFIKQYLKGGSKCKVTFTLPGEAASDAGKVTIVGDFNNWNAAESPMKKINNGDFEITLNLACGREYRFRYLIDGNRWENDWRADKYVPNNFGAEDSVVVV